MTQVNDLIKTLKINEINFFIDVSDSVLKNLAL